jgi:5'-nucleotidase
VSVEECGGFEVTRVGKRIYQDQLIERTDPRGIPYYWIGGPPPSGISVPGTDFNAVVNRRVSVTPIHLDLTGRRLLRQLREWDWTLEAAPAAGDVPTSSQAEEERLADDARLDRR